MTDISNINISLLLLLILSHLLADFPFQPDVSIKDRKANGFFSKWLHIHSFTAGFLASVILYFYQFPFISCLLILVVIYTTHVVIDYFKLFVETKICNSDSDSKNNYDSKADILLFIVDQFLHIIIIILIWKQIVNFEINIDSLCLGSYTNLWIICISYIITIWPTGIVIGKWTSILKNQIDYPKDEKLLNAGMNIGRIERVLLLTFVLLGEYSAIGLLITAKSIFRFESKGRDDVEYILIGTLISFLSAVVIGLITRRIIYGSFMNT
ncbi:DUF3307 domain-containing protein [Methanosarcina sp. DH2]|jgi:hypothetical protein|uniref:DUF3307 domain-containing protein n=1 Tax=Methanosarcina sp. DH2 TaxID=2605639 RepID=UPI001E2AD8EF|nr:DUF3307 domain-containing protein [Methanosarcina sp. DH2]MCC4771645.1 DUF3307 domain-containing protein [Methanosarcina sp. DH2]